MGLTGLKDAPLKLILFGGKGGVGKTTCAVSAGLCLAEEFSTLIVSTDPAHSLSDSLEQKFGDEVTAVLNVKNLSVIEISAKKVFCAFKEKHEQEIRKIIDTSTYLDQEDTEAVLNLPIPGIDEVMGLKVIMDLLEEGRFDKVVVDMAPTGHALRLLKVPALLDDWIKVVAKLRWKYRYMITTFAGKYTPDEGDDFLLEMKKTITRIHTLFTDRKQCEFIMVTIPEAMAVRETERLIKELGSCGIAIRQIAVNNVTPESENCRFCMDRRERQEEYIDYLENRMGNVRTTVLPMQSREVKGLAALTGFKELLFQ